MIKQFVALLLLLLPLVSYGQSSQLNEVNDFLRKQAELEERQIQERIREVIRKGIPPIQVEIPLVFAQQQGAKESSNKIPCPSGVLKNDCTGIAIGIDGVTYVGEFKMGRRDGLGVEYFPNGQMSRSGVWNDNTLVNSLYLEPSRFPLPPANQVDASVSAHSNGLFSKPCLGSYKHNCHGSNDQADGSRYTGDWVANFPHGNGVLFRTNGETVAGEWRWGEFIGGPKAVKTSPGTESPSQFLAQDESNGRLSLPACQSRGQQERCVGRLVNGYGGVYVGEIKNDLEHGIGILYSQTGSLSMAGRWEEGRFTESIVLPESRFPFSPTPQLGLTRLSDTGKAERDRLTAEVEAERKKREALEARLAAAEAKERERQLAEAKEREQRIATPPTQVASPRNPHALIIGNAAYPGSARLDNPINDANAVAQKLKAMGFTVTVVTDANRQRLVQAMSNFRKTASSADLSLLFYSGHGVQIFGTNYILPTDADQSDVAQATIQGVSLNSVVENFLPGKTKIVFLDACRDNPLQRTGDRTVSKGLAPISVAQGTLIAYATKDGQTASDGVGQKNSPFTKALLEHLSDPQDIAVILRKVREKVMTATGGKQQPWEYGSLTGGELVLSGVKR